MSLCPRCPKCGNFLLRVGEIIADGVTLAAFFCRSCEHRFATSTDPNKPK